MLFHTQRAVAILRYRLTHIGIRIIEMRWSHDSLVFIMGMPYLERRSLCWHETHCIPLMTRPNNGWLECPMCNINGIVQDRSNSIALELLQSCTEPSMYSLPLQLPCWKKYRVRCNHSPKAPFQYQGRLHKHRNSHYEYNTVVSSSYHYDGKPYNGKTTSLFWDEPQAVNQLTF